MNVISSSISRERVNKSAMNNACAANAGCKRQEWLALRDEIIANEERAYNYFYNDKRHLAEKFYKAVPAKYRDLVSVKDLCTLIYAGLYDNARWTRLQAYQGECSLDTWISNVSQQIVFKELEDEGIVISQDKLTAANTSLTLRSMRYADEQLEVISLLSNKAQRRLLKRVYVDECDDEAIMSELGLSDGDYKRALKSAECALRSALIQKGAMYWRRENTKDPADEGKVVNLVNLALSPKNSHLGINTSDEAMATAEKHLANASADVVHDLLAPLYPDVPESELWLTFLVDRSKELPWTTEERTVWHDRFYAREKPVVVAQRLDRRRSWVDNKFSRLNDELESYARQYLRHLEGV